MVSAHSVWSVDSQIPTFGKLKGDVDTDVLIIGGGLAGILCAYMLNQAGVDYILVEADRICSGITKNTTAKITSQHGLIYDKIRREFGLEKAALYLRANEEALESYKKLCRDIDCDFEIKDAFVYSLKDTKCLEKELSTLKKIGFDASFTDNLPLPFSVAGAIRFKEQAQFNPLKFVSHISKGLNIFENTKVRELIKTTAVTDGGRITAKEIVVATHFPFINKHGSYFIKMYQHRSYVVALKNAANVDGMYIDEDSKGLSFRNFGDLLLMGGGAHKTGKSGGNWQELSHLAGLYYPNAREQYRWATQDCMTLDGIPYIGRYSKNTPHMLVATGFNKWGMTSSMAAATIIRDMILEKDNPYTEVFSPSRTILRSQLAVNGLNAVVNLITPSSKRCPHLGCALKWNKYEHSWDCPCHGSRFSEKGELIDNPATADLKS